MVTPTGTGAIAVDAGVVDATGWPARLPPSAFGVAEPRGPIGQVAHRALVTGTCPVVLFGPKVVVLHDEASAPPPVEQSVTTSTGRRPRPVGGVRVATAEQMAALDGPVVEQVVPEPPAPREVGGLNARRGARRVQGIVPEAGPPLHVAVGRDAVVQP